MHLSLAPQLPWLNGCYVGIKAFSVDMLPFYVLYGIPSRKTLAGHFKA